MMVKYYQSHGSNDSEIGRRYVNAVETRNRVASSLLSEVIGHLENLTTAYRRLKAVLEVDLIEQTTSVPGQIHASINTIVQETQNSLEEFNSQIVQKFIDYYEQNVDFSVTQLVDSAKSILSSDFYFANIDANVAGSFNVSHIEKVFDYRLEFCDHLKPVLDSISNAVDGANFSTRLFVDRSCGRDSTFYNRDYDPFACFYGFQPPTRDESNYIEQLVELYQHLAEYARITLKCIPMYRTFLSEVQSWMKRALTTNSNLPLRPADRQYVLMELEDEINWLNDISRIFAEVTVVRSFVHAYTYTSTCTHTRDMHIHTRENLTNNQP